MNKKLRRLRRQVTGGNNIAVSTLSFPRTRYYQTKLGEKIREYFRLQLVMTQGTYWSLANLNISDVLCMEELFKPIPLVFMKPESAKKTYFNLYEELRSSRVYSIAYADAGTGIYFDPNRHYHVIGDVFPDNMGNTPFKSYLEAGREGKVAGLVMDTCHTCSVRNGHPPVANSVEQFRTQCLEIVENEIPLTVHLQLGRIFPNSDVLARSDPRELIQAYFGRGRYYDMIMSLQGLNANYVFEIDPFYAPIPWILLNYLIRMKAFLLNLPLK